MFFESPFHGYPTCLIFAHVVSWSTAMLTARTTRRRRPGRSLIFVCITSNIHQLKFSSTRMWYAVVMVVDMKLVYSSTCLTTFSQYELVVNGTVDNKEGKTRKVADIRMYHVGWNYLQLGCDILGWWWLTSKFFILSTIVTPFRSCVLMVDDTVDSKDN